MLIDNISPLKNQEKTKLIQQRLLEMMNYSSSLVSIKDTIGRYEFVNSRFEEVFNIKLQKLQGKTDQQVFTPLIAQQLRNGDLHILDQQKPLHQTGNFLIGSHNIILDMKYFPIFDTQGVLTSICMDADVITHPVDSTDHLNLASRIFEQAGEGIMVTDQQGVILSVNSAFTRITGYSEQQALGKTPALLKSGLNDSMFYQDLWQQLIEQGYWQGEITNRKANGELYPQWLTISAINNSYGQLSHYIGIFSDISKNKKTQQRIKHLANHDELTGLANRSLLMERLDHCLSQAKRHNENMAVLFIDLDHFKQINDTLGHDIGDQLLKQASQRMLNTLRTMDTVARLGGDEFVIILNKVHIEEIHRLVARIIDQVSRVFEIDQHTCYVSASIGISLYPEDSLDAVGLLKNADIAMYQAKENGRNQFQFFDPQMKLKSLQRINLEAALRSALEQKSIYLLYQPKINIQTDQIIGIEALARWKDQIFGQISPNQFIPIAEQSGLMTSLGEEIMHQVASQMQQWEKQGLTLPNLAINLSIRQLQDPTFVNVLQYLIDNNPSLKGKITLEITESMLMDKISKISLLLKQFASMGFLISIDNFGTGYSSLSYLKRLPIHELQIDKSFIDTIDKNDEDYAITQAIVTLAQVLNLRIVAKGVESEQQLQILKNLYCNTVQGYIYHPPLAPAKLTDILRMQKTVMM